MYFWISGQVNSQMSWGLIRLIAVAQGPVTVLLEPVEIVFEVDRIAVDALAHCLENAHVGDAGEAKRSVRNSRETCHLPNEWVL